MAIRAPDGANNKYSYYILSPENNQFLQDAEKARKMAEEICR